MFGLILLEWEFGLLLSFERKTLLGHSPVPEKTDYQNAQNARILAKMCAF